MTAPPAADASAQPFGNPSPTLPTRPGATPPPRNSEAAKPIAVTVRKPTTQTTSVDGRVRITLGSIEPSLPEQLRHKITGALHELVPVQIEQVVPQLAYGNVALTLRELRASAPELLASLSGHDDIAVALPLSEIIPQLDPSLYARRQPQRRVQIPDSVTSIFSQTASGAIITPHAQSSEPAADPVATPAPAAPAVTHQPTTAKVPAMPAAARATTPKATPIAAPGLHQMAAAHASAPAAPVAAAAKAHGYESQAPAAAINAQAATPKAPQTAAKSAPTAQAPAAPAPKIALSSQALAALAAAAPKKAAPAPTAQRPVTPAPTAPATPLSPLPRMAAPTPAAAPAAPRPAAPEPVRPEISASAAAAKNTAPLPVPLSKLADELPQEIVREITDVDVSATTVNVPMSLVESGLRSGKVLFTWNDLSNWLQPPLPRPPSRSAGELLIEIPLKVIAPIFMAHHRSANSVKKADIGENIPDLFQPANGKSEAASMIPGFDTRKPAAAPVAAPAPAPATAPSTINHQPSTSGAPSQKTPSLEEIVGPEGKRFAPKQIVQNACRLPGATGALLAMPDGLLVTSAVPASVKGDNVAAFIPQMFGRMSQYTKELGLGTLQSLTLNVEGGCWQVLKQPNIYFAVCGKPGEVMPFNILVQIAAELNKQTV